MTGSHFWKVLLVPVMCLGLIGYSTAVRKNRYPVSRSYQVPFSVINSGQGIQYYSGAPVYTAFPTVLIPNQIGLSTAQIAPLVVPQHADYKSTQELTETSAPVQTSYKPSKVPVSYYKQNFRGTGQAYGRPSSLLNYIYPAPVKTYPAMSTQKDFDIQYQPQGSSSTIYQSTVGSPFGTGKIEYVKKPRAPTSHQTYYRRVTGPSHRHPTYGSKKVYFNPKGHYHYPSKYFTHSKHFPVKYVPANSVPSTPTEAPVFIKPRPLQETSGSYAYNLGGEVRFPTDGDAGKELADDQNTRNTAPGDITRAIIRSPEVINNYDASLPIKIPSKKPYKFEVSDLIKNSDLNFVPGGQTMAQGDYVDAQKNAGVLQYPETSSYQSGQTFSNHFATLPLNAGGSSTFDIYNMAGSQAYQSNHLVSEADLEPSRTVKIPIAVIKGAHDLSGKGLFGFSTIGQGEDGKGEAKRSFTPSKRTSDWIPMSHGVTLDSENQENTNSSPSKVVRPRVEEIISGKIPQEFAPNLSRNDGSDIVTGKIPFSSTSDGHKRKGSFVDLHSSSISDTSDLVVSSMIKFS